MIYDTRNGHSDCYTVVFFVFMCLIFVLRAICIYPDNKLHMDGKAMCYFLYYTESNTIFSLFFLMHVKWKIYTM